MQNLLKTVKTNPMPYISVSQEPHHHSSSYERHPFIAQSGSLLIFLEITGAYFFSFNSSALLQSLNDALKFIFMMQIFYINLVCFQLHKNKICL